MMRTVSLMLTAAVFSSTTAVGAELPIATTSAIVAKEVRVALWIPSGRSAPAPGPGASRVPIPMAKPPLERRQLPPETICRLIETAAHEHEIPIRFLTRLIWQESRFQVAAVSHAGAQGIAQFMPATAAERDLKDPFDPRQALPAAASLLSSLERRFGNLGLAAAAYNAGPGRVSAWLRKKTRLPEETRNYVKAITGRTVRSWAVPAHEAPSIHDGKANCLSTVFEVASSG